MLVILVLCGDRGQLLTTGLLLQCWGGSHWKVFPMPMFTYPYPHIYHLNWFPPPSTKSLIIARNKPHTGQGGGWRFPPQSRQWPATAPLDTPPLWTAPNVVCRLASLMANLADWIERSSQSCIMRMKHKTFSTFSWNSFKGFVKW